jgi:hypothetical protein
VKNGPGSRNLDGEGGGEGNCKGVGSDGCGVVLLPEVRVEIKVGVIAVERLGREDRGPRRGGVTNEERTVLEEDPDRGEEREARRRGAVILVNVAGVTSTLEDCTRCHPCEEC